MLHLILQMVLHLLLLVWYILCLCECQGTKLVKCTQLTSMWKYRKKQEKKVGYSWHVIYCGVQAEVEVGVWHAVHG